MVRGILIGLSTLFTVLFLGFFARYASLETSCLWISGVIFVLIVLTSITSFFHEKGEAFSLFSSVLMLLGVLYLYVLGQNLSYALSMFALVQFVLALQMAPCKKVCEKKEEVENSVMVSKPKHSMVFDSSKSMAAKDSEGKRIVPIPKRARKVSSSKSKVPRNKVSKTGSIDGSTSTNNFVASKKGRYYHKSGSEWAVKIKEDNQVWFSSEKEAQDAGYNASRDLKKSS
ncbi:hypothetical protein HOC01_02725 [archaeon]|jgi:hypothetical protein|nr:hypothetical protein [archaeon]MBT6697765.1 hypothetical protein [archaeon]